LPVPSFRALCADQQAGDGLAAPCVLLDHDVAVCAAVEPLLQDLALLLAQVRPPAVRQGGEDVSRSHERLLVPGAHPAPVQAHSAHPSFPYSLAALPPGTAVMLRTPADGPDPGRAPRRPRRCQASAEPAIRVAADGRVASRPDTWYSVSLRAWIRLLSNGLDDMPLYAMSSKYLREGCAPPSRRRHSRRRAAAGRASVHERRPPPASGAVAGGHRAPELRGRTRPDTTRWLTLSPEAIRDVGQGQSVPPVSAGPALGDTRSGQAARKSAKSQRNYRRLACSRVVAHSDPGPPAARKSRVNRVKARSASGS